MFTNRSSAFNRLLQRSAAVIAALLATATSAFAVTNDEILPANLIGRTLTCVYGAGTPNTLEAINNFTIQFTSATTYVRSASGFATEGGTYSVLDSSIAASTGNRATTIQINNNWLSQGSTTAVLLVLTQQSGIGAYAASEFFNPLKTTGGTFTLGGTTTGGGTTVAAPAITSARTVNATVGVPFTYFITTSTPATSFTNAGGNAPVTINPSSGLVSGTFTSAGTFTFSYSATNAGGTSPVTIVTVTVAAATTVTSAPVVTSSATLTGTVGTPFNYTITGTSTPNSFRLTGAPSFLSVNATTGVITGTPNAAGSYAFTITAINTLGSGSRAVVLTVVSSSTSVTVAPYNLTGYRNRVGQTFQFTVTAALSGAVWGTDVYTDDSSVASAAIHAGVLRAGETKTVTITILAGQNSYSASTRNSVISSSWGAWAGSYSFAGSGAVSTTTATTVPAVAPGFVATTSTLAVGGRLVCPVTLSGSGPFSYRWYRNGALIPGAVSNPYVVDSATAADSGTYAADVTNSIGTSRITAGTFTIGSAGAPVFTLQPFNKVVAPGGVFALAADASGSGNTYQWLRNGVALSGETGPILLRQNVNSGDAGTYSVRVTNSAGTLTSANATVTLNANATVLANISVRTAATAGQIIIPAFTVAGTGKKRVLIRAVGPALTGFGFSTASVMADPKFDLYDGSTRITGSDNWDSSIASAFAAVGAFPLTAGSKDAALVVELDASASGRGYSVQVTGANNTAGVVLVEVYDLGNTSGGSKLTNVSVLSKADTGLSTLVLGFVLKGEGQRTLLVRGIGPKLAAFGVGGLLTDPKLQIYDSDQRTVITNNDWNGADFVSELVTAAGYVGAFALDNNSTDSASLALLQPGGYTVQVSGNDGGTGNAIAEIYEVP